VDEAHGWEKKVACHAYNGIGLQRALDGGLPIRSEHGLEISDSRSHKWRGKALGIVPTLAPYYGDWAPENTPAGKRDRKRAEVHGASVEKAVKAGIKIVYGTDMGRNRMDRVDGPGISVFGSIWTHADAGDSRGDFACRGIVRRKG
jgi:imidazolonepropionase-like amidohydrolase